MNVHQISICVFLMLQDGKTSLVNAEIPVYRGPEGGSITVECSFQFRGKKMLFCKEKCEENILIETESYSAQRGRYRIERYGFFGSVVYVTITRLTQSDSGRYRCGFKRTVFPDSYRDLEVFVTDASTTSEPNRTLRPISTRPPSAPAPTTATQSSSFGSGSFTPSPASAETTRQPGTLSASSEVLLYVGTVLLFMGVVLSLAVLMLCRTKSRKPEEPPAETEYANVTGADRAYEEIGGEDRPSGSPAVEVSTVYCRAKYTKPNGVEAGGDCSLVAAAAPRARNKAEDESDKLTYSELTILSSAVASPNSAPSGRGDAVIYSVPRAAARSAGHIQDSPATLYSTVSLH